LKSTKRKKNAVSPVVLLGAVFVALGGAAYLIPRKKELIERLSHDHMVDKAMDIEPVIESGSTPQALSAEEKFESIFALYDFSKLSEAEAETIANIANSNTHPEACWRALQNTGRLDAASHEVRRKISERVGSAMLASATPNLTLASEIFRRSVYPEQSCSENLMKRALQCFHFAINDPVSGEDNRDAAVRVYAELTNRRTLTSEEETNYCQLLRSHGEPELAFARLRKSFQQSTEPAAKLLVYPELLSCLNEVGDSKLLAVCEKHIAEIPQDLLTALPPGEEREQELISRCRAHADRMPDSIKAAIEDSDHVAEMARYTKELLGALPESKIPLAALAKAPQPLSPALKAYRDHAFDFAQYSEWSNQPDHDAAMEHYCRAAVLGRPDALVRAKDLRDDLGRQVEFLATLKHVVPVEGWPELTLEYARVMAADGDYNESAKLYAVYTAEQPQDHALQFEYGHLLQELEKFSEANDCFRKAIALAPQELSYTKTLIQSLIRSNDPSGALAIYKALPPGKADLSMLENFILLAEAEGDFESIQRAMKERMAKSERPSVEQYKELADVLVDVGNNEEAIQVLLRGLKQWPQSNLLRTSAAEFYMGHRELGPNRFTEARKLLADGDLRGDLHQASLFVEACTELDDVTGLALLGSTAIDRDWSPEYLGQIAYLFEKAGREGDSTKLYVRAAKSGSKEAMDLLVGGVDENDSEGLQRLGDVLRSLGMEKEAREAYYKALAVIQQRAKAELPEPTVEETTPQRRPDSDPIPVLSPKPEEMEAQLKPPLPSSPPVPRS
jgi:tetratricopeptide (TPR) repeat protein